MKYKDEILKIGAYNCKQVNKTTARKLFDAGESIYLHPCNMMLENAWQLPFSCSNKNNVDFDNLVNTYTYYNCLQELGSYANFFTEIN